MGSKQRTELRDISDAGAELDESQLQGVNGGMQPESAFTGTGWNSTRDDMVC
ncbi:hypothetical protein ACOZ38_21355 [Sphaerisporangium viridialbum]|uniref:hypothetical protein n=1 Tax=Sphaerisporangium viridialbum TaxID=46189 RepID=UPI003C76C55E